MSTTSALTTLHIAWDWLLLPTLLFVPALTWCPSLFMQALGIRRYVFMSIFNCDKHPEVPLMNIKAATEQFLASNSKLPYTVLRLCGFHQVRWAQTPWCVVM